MMSTGALYEIAGTSIFIVSLVWAMRLWQKNSQEAYSFASMLLVGLFFGSSWEPQGTGPVWSYHNFNIYAYCGIPLVVILDWSWAMILCWFISKQMLRVFRMMRLTQPEWFLSKASVFLSGALVASIVEPVFVSLGMWQYNYVGDKAVLSFPLSSVHMNLAVIVGWGLLTTMNLTSARQTARPLAIRLGRFIHMGQAPSLVISSSVLGLLNGWLSWQIVLLFTTLIENVEPRIFFTARYVVTLDWITSGQLAAVLAVIVLSFASRYRAREAVRPLKVDYEHI